jgi:hypothetical protein
MIESEIPSKQRRLVEAWAEISGSDRAANHTVPMRFPKVSEIGEL